jgi:hypothetical protein
MAAAESAEAAPQEKKRWNPLRRLRRGMKRSTETSSGGEEATVVSVTVAVGDEDDAETDGDTKLTHFDLDVDVDDDDDDDEDDEAEKSKVDDKRFQKTQVYPLGARRGKVVLVNRTVTTSGRRIQDMGNFKVRLYMKLNPVDALSLKAHGSNP